MGFQYIILFFLSLFISGCVTVGPDYTQPELPQPDYSDVLQQPTSQATSEQGEITPELLADWWNTLEDPLLTDLIQQALSGSLDIQEAQASVREARGMLGIRRAELFPMLDARGSYEKTRSSESTVFKTGENDFYRAGFDANWEIDIFGGRRRDIEAAYADLQSREENLNAVWVSLAAEVAQSYITLRTFQRRLQVAETNLDNQIETYEILKSSYEAGLINELALQQAKYNLERTRSMIPTIRSGLESVKNALGVLTGTMPGELHALLQEPKPIPVSSLKIVTGIPANSLRRRPDIREAERQLAAQTARIGAAEAQLYPKFFLFGSIGLESIDTSSFLSWNSKTWAFGPSISWPIFHAGSIRGNIRVQTALQEQFLARYEKTVLAAVKEVRDALTDYAEEQERRSALRDAVQAAQRAVEVSQDQYINGLSDFNNVLDAQRSLLSLQDSLAVSEGEISTHLVRLYKALGGGWSAVNNISE